MMLYRYVAFRFLRYFFLITAAMILFFAGIDMLQHAAKLPEGFNTKVLYFYYRASYALNLLFPISLVLGMIVAKMDLIRSNALVSFYALGYSSKSVMRPFFWSSVGLTIIYIMLHFTPFVNSDTYAKEIMTKEARSSVTNDLFVKYDDSFIYMQRLYPFEKRAEGIRIYSVEAGQLRAIVKAESARFVNDVWVIDREQITTKPPMDLKNRQGIEVTTGSNLITLEGFKPKILDSVFEGKQYFTIQDAYNALFLLNNQQLETDKVKTVLYYMTLFPFFAPLLIMIFFLTIKPHARYGNLLWTSMKLIGVTLFVWGADYLLYRISLSEVVAPEAGLIGPIGVLGAAALYTYLIKTERL